MRNIEHIQQKQQAPSAVKRWARAALITAPIMAFAMLIVAPAANADGYRNGHHAGHHNRGYNRGYNRSYNRHHNRRHYRRHGFRHHGYNHRGYRYGRHSRHDNRGAYLIGGLVVGSLITHAITNNRNHYRDEYRNDHRLERRSSNSYDRNKSYSTYATGPSARGTNEAPVSRRLFRDAQGNCFERQIGSDNQELLIDLPAEECRW